MAEPRWIEPNEALPAIAAAATAEDAANAESGLRADAGDHDGLIAVGRDIGARRLFEAYNLGLFPWYTDGQPVLWWSPDPRMVLYLDEFRVRRSLRQTIKRRHRQQCWRLSLNYAFEEVMRACAQPRDGQDGTWITSEMTHAYVDLHHAGYAHSVEVWNESSAGSTLVGGLYGVSIGRMFFGESMFANESDASKVALVALVQLLREQGFRMIDCQQKTGHLASFGAREVPRQRFLTEMRLLTQADPVRWQELQIGFPAA